MILDERSGVAIVGVGHHLPAHIETNEELCGGLSITPDWIVEKTGIKRRHIAATNDTASQFAASAARNAMVVAGIEAPDLDLIISCTFSGDYLFPPLSTKLHHELGAKGAQTFDLQANCAGLVAGLTTASDRMRADPSVRYALVVGVELNSRYVDRKDVNTAIYLSDGAGAVVLGRCDALYGIRSSAFFTDSSNYEAVRMRGGGSSYPLAQPQMDPQVLYMEMNGIATWKQAITHLPSTIRRCCDKSGITTKDVDFFIFHQANLRLIEYIVRRLGVDLSRTYTNVEEIGNTGSASVAIALSEAVQKDLIRPNSTVMLAAVGAGFNFGASIWRWLPYRIGTSG